MENDQVGTIKYENSAKIYQPTGMTLNATGAQRYNNDLIQSIVYNENNDPVFIDGEKGDVAFQYGLSNMRQRVSYGGNFSTDGDGKFTKFYSEDGSFEVVKNNVTGKEKHILYIGGTPYESNIIYLKNYDETNGSYKFLHKDYLGSILAVSDEAGNKLEQRHFDAWGNFTHLQIGNGAIITDKNIIDATSLLVERGYTSHEHFAEVGIIHMNGRLYDPLLRRFLNADENIQAPFNTQNYNRYGYVANNPLMYFDPSGEVAWIVVGAVVGAVAGAYFTGVKANGSWNPAKWNWGATWGKIAMGGAIGAFTGVVGGAVGVSAAAYAATAWGINGGLLGGAIAGASGGAVAGAINGFATSVMFGENVIEGTLMGGLSGVAIGGVVGGVSGAIGQVVKNAQAAKIGAPQGTILKNQPIAVGRSQWTLNNTPKTSTVGATTSSKTSTLIIGGEIGESVDEFAGYNIVNEQRVPIYKEGPETIHKGEYVKTTHYAGKTDGFGSMMEAGEAARYAKYWQNYAPKLSPGTKRLDWLRVSGRTGQFENSRVIYDNHGRQIYRVDFSDHMRPLDHSVPHLHEYQFGRGFDATKGKESLFNFWNK